MPTGQGHERTFLSHCRTCWLSSTSLWLLLSSSSSSTSSFGSSSSPRACLGRGEEKLGWKRTLLLRFGDGVPKHLVVPSGWGGDVGMLPRTLAHGGGIAEARSKTAWQGGRGNALVQFQPREVPKSRLRPPPQLESHWSRKPLVWCWFCPGGRSCVESLPQCWAGDRTGSGAWGQAHP